MCKDTYVPHKFLLQIVITYLMYMFDTFIKVKRGCRGKSVTLKKITCFNFSLNLPYGNLCWSVVKLIKLKLKMEWTNKC